MVHKKPSAQSGTQNQNNSLEQNLQECQNESKQTEDHPETIGIDKRLTGPNRPAT